MLKRIIITKENSLHHRFSQGNDIDLTFSGGLNLLIGANGSGKSTFFNILRNFLFKEEREGILLDIDKSKLNKPVYFVASEENNPQLNLNEISPLDRHSTHKIAYWMDRKELSNGQNTFAMLNEVQEIAKEASLVIFDEPEKALDAVALLEFKDTIKDLSETVQVIIITHHPALILDSGFAKNVVEMNVKKPYFNKVKKLLKF